MSKRTIMIILATVAVIAVISMGVAAAASRSTVVGRPRSVCDERRRDRDGRRAESGPGTRRHRSAPSAGVERGWPRAEAPRRHRAPARPAGRPGKPRCGLLVPQLAAARLR